MFRNLRYRFALFMQGRYGTDQLSRFLSVVVIILLAAEWIANHFLAFPGMLLFVRIAGILNAVLLFAIYFRTFSRNIPRRYAENQKFLGLKDWNAFLEGKLLDGTALQNIVMPANCFIGHCDDANYVTALFD